MCCAVLGADQVTFFGVCVCVCLLSTRSERSCALSGNVCAM